MRHPNITEFLFDSFYQVVTWVCIGLAVGGLWYFASKDNGRGVLWSVCALFCSIVIMISIIADKYFFRAIVPPIGSPQNASVERPELSIDRVLPRLAPGKPVSVTMQITNRGKAAALNIAIGGADFFAPKSFNGLLEKHDFPKSDTRPSLAGGAPITVDARANTPISREQVAGIQAGNLLWFRYGDGQYQDGTGNSYHFEFCFMYDPLRPDSMRICPTQYRLQPPRNGVQN